MSMIDSVKEQFKALEAPQKAMAIGASVIILLCTIWIMASIIPALFGPPVAREADTPAWRVAKELNEKLMEEQAFLDVGFSVETESPLRYAVNGAVYSPADMQRLQNLLKELRPEGDYDFNVEILRK